MTARPRPNQRLLAIVRLAEIAAERDTEFMAHVMQERITCDGYSHGGAIDDGSRGTTTNSTTEAAMLARQHLDGYVAQRDDDITALASILNSLLGLYTKALTTRGPTKEKAPRCTADPGHAGYMTPIDEGGWHLPDCTNLPRYSTGLCDPCRKRQERWRARHDERPIADERVVQFDSEVRMVEGVAIVRPTRGEAA